MREIPFTRTLLASLGAGIVVAGMAMPVAAQQAAADEDDFGIEEIVVVSRFREERLQDVPATVTALTQQTLEDAGVQRIEDFIGLTPGVTLVQAAEVGDAQVNIRGINGSRDSENSFAFIIDGILMTNPAAFNREFADLQQIEILKGPQGALYGRNAAAGAIIVTTTKPGPELTIDGTASIANNDSRYASVMASGPLIGDSVFARVQFDWRDTDGFYTNTFLDQKNVDQFENYNFNWRILIEPSDAFSLDLKARYGEVNGSAISFNAAFALPAFAAAFASPAAFEDVNEHEFIFEPNIVSDNDQRTIELSAKFDADLGWASLTGWLLFSDIDNDFIADGTSGAFGFFATDQACIDSATSLLISGYQPPPPTFLNVSPIPVLLDAANGSFLGPYTPLTCDGIQEQLREQQDFSLELRLASPDSQQLRWLAGIYFLTIDRRVGVSLNRDSGQPPFRGLFQRAEESPNFTEALVFDQFDSTVFAIFAQLAYDITEDVEASFAIRYDHENRKVTNLVPTDVVTRFVDFDFDGPGGSPLNPGLDPNINPAGITDQERSFEEVEPKISLSWDVADGLTLFGSWGVGFKSGGFNNQGSQATIDLFINGAIAGFLTDPATGVVRPLVMIEDSFEKETSSAFEIGFKSRLFGNRLTAEGAFYYVDVDDMQFFEFFVGPFGLLRVVSNIDSVKIKGVEFAAHALLTDNLSVFGGFNFVDSEIKANSARPDTIGNKSPYTPDYTVNLGAQIDFPVMGNMTFVTRVDAQLIGKTWFHVVQNNTRPTILSPLLEFFFGPQIGIPAGAGALGEADWSLARRDAFATLNLRSGLEGDTWAIIAFVQNLTNNHYLEEVIPAPEFGGSFIHPAARRTWGVEVSARF